MTRAIELLLAATLALNSDCATNPKESHLDRLWKQGYGFNNPNPERVRNGQKPLNFGERK